MKKTKKIYLAADIKQNADLIQKIKALPFDFVAPDGEIKEKHAVLSCDIKTIIDETLDQADGVIIVAADGDTPALNAGGCDNCNSYNPWFRYCGRDLSHRRKIDHQNYLEYIRRQATAKNRRIVVLDDTTHGKSFTNAAHVAAYITKNNQNILNAQAIIKALTDPD